MAICTIIEAITILKVEARELGKEFLNKNKNIKMLTYDTIKSIRYSDHRPVVGTFLINIDNKKNSNNKSVNYMKMNSDNINEQNDLIYKGIKDKNEYKENINNDKLNDKNRIKKSEIKRRKYCVKI